MLGPGLVATPVSGLVSKQKADLGFEAVSTELCWDHLLWFPQLCISPVCVCRAQAHLSPGVLPEDRADPLAFEVNSVTP